MWKNYNYGATIGRKGSENGTILKDEEYNDLCRITLKKCSRYYAVTCGIYGELVHTAFADDGDMLYSNMKKELQTYLESDMCEDEASEFFERFCDKF